MPTEFDVMDFWQQDSLQKYQKAESVTQVKTRVYSLLNELKQYTNKNILIVSHGGISCFFVSYFKGDPQDNNFKQYIIKNGEIAIFDFNKIATKTNQGENLWAI